MKWKGSLEWAQLKEDSVGSKEVILCISLYTGGDDAMELLRVTARHETIELKVEDKPH